MTVAIRTVPKTMKAAKAFDYDDVRLVELPVPKIGPGEALVQVACSGICSGDVTPWYIKKKCPIVVGHEPAGRIVALGAGAPERFQVGDRVFLHHHAPCYDCRPCQRGAYSMCATWRSSQLDPGGLAEYVRVPRVNLAHDTLKLPEELDYPAGALIEPIACVVKAFRRGRFRPGDRVAVIGLGFIGQAMVRLASHWGSPVVASDLVDFRLARALEMGADAVFHPGRDSGSFAEFVRSRFHGEGADLVLIGPSSPAAIREGIAAACPGGRALMFMAPEPGRTMEIEPNDLFFREVDLLSSYSCGPDDTRQTMELLRRGVFPVEQLITHRFPLERALEACRLTARAQESLKVLVELPFATSD